MPADEIRSSLDHLSTLLAPADEEAIVVMLLPLGELFGPPRPESVPRYVETLGDIPAEALATAVSRCLRECKFFPVPAEIRERADGHRGLLTARMRLETALWRIDFEGRKR